MSVDREEVERIGRLAKLRLTDDETDRLTAEMNRILEHAERLRGLEETPEAGSAGDDADANGGGAADAVDAAGGDVDDEGADGEEGDIPPARGPGGPRPSGTRSPGAETPDPLRIGLPAFAPDVREGFFVVPPPPGVVADEDEAADDGEQASSRDAEGRSA